jgi:hypothetical protein
MSIFIKAKTDGFRRCGVAHSSEGREFPDGHFSEEELQILQDEPEILVVAGMPEDDDPGPTAGTATDTSPTKKAEPEPPKPDPGHAAMMLAVCIAIEDGNTTKSGAPEVDAMEEILGENISAADRDAVWDAWKKENNV